MPDALTAEQLQADVDAFSEQDKIFLDAEIAWTKRARDREWLPPRSPKNPSSEGYWSSPQVLPKDFVGALVMTGRGWGKLVAVNTKIATPTGWATIGKMSIGDALFDEAGRVCRIKAIFDGLPEKAYRLYFSDGTHIDACNEHQWVTWTHRDRKELLRRERATTFPDDWPLWSMEMCDRWGNVRDRFGPQIRTTQEIVDTLTYNKQGDVNHCIPIAAPLQMPDVELPCDPWLLGYWLGNGHMGQARLTAGSWKGEFDFDYVAERLDIAGIIYRRHDEPNKGQSTFSALKPFEILAFKHVPAPYFRASERQRLELLRGLMDSDGHAGASKVEFSSSRRQLAEDVLELVRTLGEKPRIIEGRATLHGKDMGPKWRIVWRPTTHNPFGLPRKARKCVTLGAQGLRNRHRMIVRAELIEPTPMRCLTVDSPNSMFLVGEAMIPTHNTDVAANWSRRKACTLPGSIGHVIAPTFSDLRFTVFEGVSGLLKAIPEQLITDYNRSDYYITLYNGSMIRGFSSEKPDRLRGPQCHWAWWDEQAASVRIDEVQSNIDFSLRLVYELKDSTGLIRRVQPQIVYTTTPRPLDSIRALAEDPKIYQVRGSLYENRANLAERFFETVTKHEGTRLGEQEIYGVLLNFDERAIIKKRWIRMWPKDRPLPQFEAIVISLDTAQTEDTYDEKKNEADPTACTVWGVFLYEKRMCVMLLDSWAQMLGMPELIEAAKIEVRKEYGIVEPEEFKVYAGKGPTLMRKIIKPTLMIVEDIGSGKGLRQMLAREVKDKTRDHPDIPIIAYNPGKMGKLERINSVAYVVKGGSQEGLGRMWIPESVDSTPEAPKFASWADQYLAEVCIYSGPGSTKHDDYVDSSSQFLLWFANNYLPGSVSDKIAKPKPRPERRGNPYGS